MNEMVKQMIMNFFSQIPEETFDARLREIGIEEDNIKKLKEMMAKEGGFNYGNDRSR